MSDFEFKCPHCKQLLEAPDDMRGRAIECPACNGSVRLPKIRPCSLSSSDPQSKEIKELPSDNVKKERFCTNRNIKTWLNILVKTIGLKRVWRITGLALLITFNVGWNVFILMELLKIKSTVENTRSDVENIRSDVSAIENEPTRIVGRYSSYSHRSIRSVLGSIESDVENIKSTVENTESDVENIKSTVENTESDVENIKRKINYL